MDVLAQFGVEAGAVGPPSTADHNYPQVVAGRVAHIDADFTSYQVSAESKAELDPLDPTPRKTYEDMQLNAVAALEHTMRLAGAERAICHVTGKGSTKGGRDNQALLKPYQANRKDRETRPENLDAIRKFIGELDTGTLVGQNSLDEEADDAMSSAVYNDPDNAVVCSMDKDLWMVPGLYFDWDNSKVVKSKDTFGYIEIKEMVSPTTGKVYKKKLVGRGTKYFWAQLLMGDTADNIQGVGKVPGSMWQQYAGTKAYADTYKQWIAADDKEVADKLAQKLRTMEAKSKPCGDVLAYTLLGPLKTDRECYAFVRSVYQALDKVEDCAFKDYRTDQKVSATKALFSEMQLLWMRRTKDPLDVLAWLKKEVV